MLELVQTAKLGSMRATDLPCVLHPHAIGVSSLYQELHHVIPRDWQDEQLPSADHLVPAKVTSASDAILWDPRTISCCRTGHGNIHYLLVRFMLAWEDAKLKQNEKMIGRIVASVVLELRAEGKHLDRDEIYFAQQAMLRWDGYGLDLMQLCANKSYGRI